jgi:hypothetical protein
MDSTQDGSPKQIPAVLQQPIEYDAPLLVAGAFKPQDEFHRAAALDFIKQYTERYLALFEYFGISCTDPNAEFNLILRLAAEVFPAAFRCVRKGEKTRGNKTRWNTAALLKLWSEMKKLIEQGMTVEDAASQIAKKKLIPGPVLAPQSIIARYYDADQMVARFKTGAVTRFEELDYLAFVYGVDLTSKEEQILQK